MIRWALAFFLISLLPQVYAQEKVLVVPIEGKVLYRTPPEQNWAALKEKTFLDKESEISTKKKSSCLLVFNKEVTDVVKVNENSHVKVINLYKLYLYQGEAMALVKNLKPQEKFEIQTPVAISGARGTGWYSRMSQEGNSVGCLEHSIYVEGIGSDGSITGEEDLGAGEGITVRPGGSFGSRFRVGEREREGFENMRGAVEGGASGGEDTGGSGGRDDSGLEDLRQEAEDDWQQNNNESDRSERERDSNSQDESVGGGSCLTSG